MSHVTLDPAGFQAYAPVAYQSKASECQVRVPPEAIVEVIASSNTYLYSLAAFFEDADFDFYDNIGQRNLSGFIGEVFANAFVKQVAGYAVNPHADGRPDLLDLATRAARRHLEHECFQPGERNPVPLKTPLAPFRYGGLEVKTSIGSPVSGYKKRLAANEGVASFSIGMPRIDYLRSITYWGHHASCDNLLGLYYDYVPELDASPRFFSRCTQSSMLTWTGSP